MNEINISWNVLRLKWNENGYIKIANLSKLWSSTSDGGGKSIIIYS